ncbi:MAG: GSU2203 family decaheme c-type cytochrome [Candidatus Zixiibacteriota bacterium]
MEFAITRVRKPHSSLIGALAILALVFPVMTSAPSAAGVCAECHAEVSESFHNMPHGLFLAESAAWKENPCEACHGQGSAHITSGDPNQIINPARIDQFGSRELCLSCHNGPQFDDWSVSHHSTADVSCASCHIVHQATKRSLRKETPELCYDCHSGVRAAATMPSHHPIAEGKLACEDCHGIHGGDGTLTQESTGRELCLTCHADKEGPFVYEHAPVNEDCQICHTPHGAVADNLLKQTEPALCLGCHSMHFHATAEGVDGPFTDPMARDRDGISTTDGFKRVMLTKCTQCHPMIHGSDLPSQAISTGGNALTR